MNGRAWMRGYQRKNRTLFYDEFGTKGVTFHQPLKDDDDGLRGFGVKDADG
jgi:hypothetical protein